MPAPAQRNSINSLPQVPLTAAQHNAAATLAYGRDPSTSHMPLRRDRDPWLSDVSGSQASPPKKQRTLPAYQTHQPHGDRGRAPRQTAATLLQSNDSAFTAAPPGHAALSELGLLAPQLSPTLRDSLEQLCVSVPHFSKALNDTLGQHPQQMPAASHMPPPPATPAGAYANSDPWQVQRPSSFSQSLNQVLSTLNQSWTNGAGPPLQPPPPQSQGNSSAYLQSLSQLMMDVQMAHAAQKQQQQQQQQQQQDLRLQAAPKLEHHQVPLSERLHQLRTQLQHQRAAQVCRICSSWRKLFVQCAAHIACVLIMTSTAYHSLRASMPGTCSMTTGSQRQSKCFMRHASLCCVAARILWPHRSSGASGA